MAGEEEKREGKGFTVQDRRRFSPDSGESRDTGPERPDAAEQRQEQPESFAKTESPEAKEPLPEINFSTFVISLSTQALMHLGEIANPLSGQEEKDVSVAKQMIDIVGMLQEKTRGNLSEGEAKLIEDILFDLRMRYVEAVKKK
jgi:hypothetical protein